MKVHSLVEEYALRKGWHMLRANVFVEGTSDVFYFSLASALYEKETSKSLIGVDCAFIAIGQGDSGGTFGMCEQFPTLVQIVRADPDSEGKARYRLLSLLDNDNNGRSAMQGMCKSNRNIRENQNVFLLNFKMPRRSRDSKILTNHIKNENSSSRGVDCEVEDLVSEAFLSTYEMQAPHHLIRKFSAGAAIHREWTRDGKVGLRQFVEQHALLPDLTTIVESIKSIRFYLGLPEDGIAYKGTAPRPNPLLRSQNATRP